MGLNSGYRQGIGRADRVLGDSEKRSGSGRTDSHLMTKKIAFQIRSSWAQFLRFLRFWRLARSISCVFSIPRSIPTPPPPPSQCLCNQQITAILGGLRSRNASLPSQYWRRGNGIASTSHVLPFFYLYCEIRIFSCSVRRRPPAIGG
jgi:hypothetical protein